jgi:hypothetical protein
VIFDSSNTNVLSGNINKIEINKSYASSKPKQPLINKSCNNLITQKNEKVSANEGFKLLAEGFKDKFTGLIKSIIKHPVKTAVSIGATTLALAALPLIGVSITTGSAILSLAFAAFAIGKTAIDSYKIMKHSENKDYNQVRKGLYNIGGDGFDLALSLPFVPKSIIQVQRQVKYSPVIKFNSKFWNIIKNTNGLKAKMTKLIKRNLRLTYNQLIKERHLESAPKLVFKKYRKGKFIRGEHNFEKGQICINTERLTFWSFNGLDRYFSGLKRLDRTISHELKHAEQYSKMARTEGIGLEGIKQARSSKITTNSQVYETGVQFHKGTAEAKKAYEYIEAIKNYPYDLLKKFKQESLFKYKLYKLNPFSAYNQNLLEKEAHAAGKEMTLFRADPNTNLIQNQSIIASKE